MPTDYTSDIEDGISFKIYATRCARNFLLSNPSKDDNTYHLKIIEKAKQEIAKLTAMSPKEREIAAYSEYREAEKLREDYLKKKEKRCDAYEKMLMQVNNWTPPSPDHLILQKFMRDQLEFSIKMDCSNAYDPPKPEWKSGDLWAAEKQELLMYQVSYHEREQRKQEKMAQKASNWVDQLLSSL